MPSDPDTRPWLPIDHLWTDLIDDSCNLMTRNTRVLNPGPLIFSGQLIAVADSTCQDSHPHVPSTGLWYFALDQFERTAGFADLRSHHLFHSESPLGIVRIKGMR